MLKTVSLAWFAVSVISAVATVTLLMLFAYPKSRAGQADLNAKIRDANLRRIASVDYGCTGPLSFVEDTCSTNITIKTDDLDEYERARLTIVDTLGIEAYGVCEYGKVTYENALDTSADEIRLFDGPVRDDSAIKAAEVSVGNSERARVSLDITGWSVDTCGLTDGLLRSGGYGELSLNVPADIYSTDRRLIIDELTPDIQETQTYRMSCAILSDFMQDDASTGASVNLQSQGAWDGDPMRVYVSDVDGGYDASAVRAWFNQNPLPAAVDFDVCASELRAEE